MTDPPPAGDASPPEAPPSEPLRVRDRATSGRPRHRAGRRPLPAGLPWPLAALALLTLLGVRVVLAAPGGGEGRLAADGYLTATAGDLPAFPLLPRGFGSLLVAAYGEVTGAFGRHAGLPGVGREILVVAVLCAALLLWSTGRRAGVGNAAGAVSLLVFGVPLLLGAGVLDDLPAILALPWLVAAAWLPAPGRTTRAAGVLAALFLVPAVLLAPATLLLVTSGAAVRALERAVPTVRAEGPRARPGMPAVVTVLLVAAFVAVAANLPRWNQESTPAAGAAAVLAAASVLLLVGGLAAWRLPHRHVPAMAVVATAAADFVLAGPLAPLVVTLPVAALLAGELLAAAAGRALRVAPSPALGRRVAVGIAGGLLAAAATAIVLVPPPAGGRTSSAAGPTGPGPATASGPTTPSGSGTTASTASTASASSSRSGSPQGSGTRTRPALTLARWVDGELPRGARLVADRTLVAELRHAGFPAAELSDRPAPPHTGSPTFLVTDGAVPPGGRVVGRIERSDGSPLLVVDPSPGTPTQEELQSRRALASAVLANPTTRARDGARAVLRSADVDPRLLAILAALAARSGVGISALPAPPHSPPQGLLAREALLGSVGGAPVGTGDPATEQLVRWLRAQLPPFLPDRIDVTADGVLIAYRYASDPDAIVTAATN